MSKQRRPIGPNNLIQRAVAVAGLIVVALGSPSYGALQHSAQHPQSGHESRVHPPPPAQAQALNPKPRQEPVEYRPNCQHPKDVSEASECDYRRSAEAAQSQVRWAFWQFLISAFGLVGLIGTLIYTARAAIAAQKSAAAAEKSVEQAQSEAVGQAERFRQQLEVAVKSVETAKLSADAAVAAERAWLLLDNNIYMPPLNPAGGTQTYIIKFKFKNFGKTPAIITDIARDAVYRMHPDLTASDLKFAMAGVEEPVASGAYTQEFQAKFRISPSEIQSMRNGGGSIYLIGGVRYRSVFDTDCVTAFCLRWSPQIGTFTALFGSTLNYRT